MYVGTDESIFDSQPKVTSGWCKSIIELNAAFCELLLRPLQFIDKNLSFLFADFMFYSFMMMSTSAGGTRSV